MDYTLLFTIDDALVFFYTFAFFYCVVRTQFGSSALSLISLVPLEYFMSDIRDPLIGFVTLHSSYAAYIWYPFWILCYTLYIVVLRIAHREQRFEHSRIYIMISQALFVLIAVQTIGLLNYEFIGSGLIRECVTFAIPAINISIFIYAAYYLIRYER